MVAPGSYVDSTYPNGSFGLMSGTSMASPHVSGAVALFFEQYRNQYGEDPSPALVKAAFLPVAHDLAGYQDADNNPMGHPFDSKQGWGRLDAAAVLDPDMMVFYVDQPVSLEFTGDTWSYQVSISESILDLRLMLVWTDAPGHGLGGATPAWVNDLDLSLSIDGQTYLGNNFGPDGFSTTGGAADGMNNTEGIFLSNPPTGTYTLTVTAANLSGDGIPNEGDETDQDFTLALYVETENDLYEYLFPILYR
jgi:subtilisin family serine protease